MIQAFGLLAEIQRYKISVNPTNFYFKHFFCYRKLNSLVLSITVFLYFIIFSTSCKHDPFGINNFDTLCFSNDIQPILINSCGMTGCHDINSQHEGFYAASYESVMQFVTPGNAKSSRLYNVLSALYSPNMMPPNQPLSKENRTKIEIWIEQGAKESCSPVVTNPGTTDPGTSKDTVCFAQSILPIIQSSCAVSNCHDPVSKVEGYDFSSYSSILSSEEAIVPFLPNESKIYKSITKTSGDDRMPPFPRPRLTDEQINAIKKWITQGALNSNCPSESCDTTTVISFSSKVFPIIQRNCTGCHGTSNPNGNVSLTNYTQIKTYAETHRNGIPILSGVLNNLPGFASMPPYGKLDKCTIRTIELWIEQGKLNN